MAILGPWFPESGQCFEQTICATHGPYLVQIMTMIIFVMSFTWTVPWYRHQKVMIGLTICMIQAYTNDFRCQADIDWQNAKHIKFYHS